MKPESVIITPPEGYEIDRENSTFECIKFKPKKLTYKDIARKLFAGKDIYYSSVWGDIKRTCMSEKDDRFDDATNCTTSKQVEKLLALNKLINVAKYLNGDWRPFEEGSEKYSLVYDTKDNLLRIFNAYIVSYGSPVFKTQKLAEQAIEILGEETIKLALSQV